MRRREFIKLIGGAAVAGPLAARAQQVAKVYRIGFLGTSSPSLEKPSIDAFVGKLRELGYVEGKSLVVEYRWAEGIEDRFPELAAELVSVNPDVIVTTGTPGTLAAKRATGTIPIVFASSGNPINTGLVSSFARPGGNVTGFTISGAELEGRRVQLLKDTLPTLSARSGMELHQSRQLRLPAVDADRGSGIGFDTRACHGCSSRQRFQSCVLDDCGVQA